MEEEIKKFYRSRTDRILFGVCGGLGKYFGVDPILFRLLFVLLFLMEGAGVLLYIIMVVITPEEPGRSDKEKDLEGEFDELAGKIERKAEELSGENRPKKSEADDSRSMLGMVIIILGMFLLAKQFFPMDWLDTDILWSVLIIGIGFYIIFKK